MEHAIYPERKSISLKEMLAAREKRASRQHSLPLHYGQAMICFTLNIAGPVKRFHLADMTFQEGEKFILSQLHHNGTDPIWTKKFAEDTGCEEYLVVGSDPLNVKRWMAEIEESGSLGRLFDIDVIRYGGKKVTRGEIGLPERRCLICGEPAYACARSRKHPVTELQTKTFKIMTSYFANRYADGIASLAVRALLFEICTTPKPGLVDCENSGSHGDMDIFTFMSSAASLFPYFRDAVLLGLHFQGTPEQLFEHLRIVGKQAEDEMFSATNGINTHKGLIYSMGIICSAVGHLQIERKEYDIDAVFDFCAEMTNRSVKKDFSEIKHKVDLTHGEKLFSEYGITGIRGEVSGGFQSVRKVGVPVLEHFLAKGLTVNESGTITLLYYIASVHDSNAAFRSGPEAQNVLREKISKQLSGEPAPERLLHFAKRLDGIFIDHNISPGGCADLLAITYFVYFYKQSITDNSRFINKEDFLWTMQLNR